MSYNIQLKNSNGYSVKKRIPGFQLAFEQSILLRCPQTGQTVGLFASYLNTDTVNAFFRQFEKEVYPNVHVFMIWYQAGFHTSKNVKVPENVTLIPLPSYSPQLNPIEKLWQFLRQHYWSNRIYNSYDHLRQAANESWYKVCICPEKIKSICRAKYIENAVF